MRFANRSVAAATLMTGAILVAPGNAHAGHLGLGAPSLATQVQDQTLIASTAYRGSFSRAGSFSAGRPASHFSSSPAHPFVASSPQRFIGSQNFVSQQRFVNTQRFVSGPPVVNQQRFVAQQSYVSPQRFVGSQNFVNQQRFVSPQRFGNAQPLVNQQRFVTPQPYIGQQRFANSQPYIYPRSYVRRGYPYIIGGLGVGGAYYYGSSGYAPYGATAPGYDDDAVAYCVETYGDAFDINTMTYLADDGRRYPCP